MSFINWGQESPEQLEIRRRLEEQALLEQAAFMAARSANAAATAAAGSGGVGGERSGIFYLRATVSNDDGETFNTEPWDNPANLIDMNSVFGPEGWSLGLFETLDLTQVFSRSTRYIFIDGSCGGTNEFISFLSSNLTLLQNWVHSGGHLFLNAAPNEGPDFEFGFGGVELFNGSSNDVTIAPGAEGHPIFAGPGECGTDWTGGSFAHARIEGPVTTLIQNPGQQSVLSELTWGEGKVLFGGMTIDHFHNPQPQATFLRQNIHAYMAGVTYTPTFGLKSMGAERTHDSQGNEIK